MTGDPVDDGGGPEPVTHADLEELTSGLTALQDAFEELRAARTPAARRDAREAADDAQEDLDTTARRLGVSRAKLEESIAAAKKAEQKDALREPLRELLDELEQERVAAAAAADPPDPPATRRRASSSAATSDDPTDEPHVDDPPVREHWSERGVGGMLK